MSAGPDMVLLAPAKLNLRLEVTGVDRRGYHLIDTDMVPVTVFDTVRLRQRDDGEVSCGGGPPLPDGQNLAFRAATALKEATGCKQGVHIEIDKRIPAGAGMGGGSSDAAATLKGLLRLWDVGLDGGALGELALGLGADVPFFLRGLPARARGVGDILGPLECGREHFAIAVPEWRASTGDVYHRHDDLVQSGIPCALGDLAARMGRNDLAAAAADLAPPGFADLARGMLDLFGNACMTGSGSAVFAKVGEGPLPAAPPGLFGRWCGKVALLEAETVVA